MKLMDAGLFERKVMQQYYEIREDGGRFLPDRYVEGECPNCGAEGARGDQCDEVWSYIRSTELKNPKSKMNPGAAIEIRDTEHFFYRLDFSKKALKNMLIKTRVWKPNVKGYDKTVVGYGTKTPGSYT